MKVESPSLSAIKDIEEKCWFRTNLVKLKEVFVVLGNDKCDLDSTVAILTFSLLLQDLRAADIKVGLCFRQTW